MNFASPKKSFQQHLVMFYFFFGAFLAGAFLAALFFGAAAFLAGAFFAAALVGVLRFDAALAIT